METRTLDSIRICYPMHTIVDRYFEYAPCNVKIGISVCMMYA